MSALLTREEFNRAVFRRSSGRCVFCTAPAVDAHHLLERKLWGPSQGYFLDNGAAVCAAHHWDCETTVVTVEAVRRATGITSVLLPEGFDPAGCYDKWGNACWASGLRSWGPLAHDTGARKALATGGYLGLMMPATYREALFFKE